MGLLDWILGRTAARPNPLPARATPAANSGGMRGAAELASRLGATPDALRAVPIEYHQFQVPKRSGKPRQIAAPAPELKALQRRILRRILSGPRAHPAATGFERGHSIVTNARLHVGQAVVLRIDLRDFFTSIDARRVERYLRRIGWDAEAAAVLVRLCTHRGSLPQGAPTSPRLSNLVNRDLDARVQALADKLGARYSRYADDLTFSFSSDDRQRVHSLLGNLGLIIKDCGYEMHTRRKLHIRRRHEQQLVTGLVVNERVQLPRAKRRWLRAVEHHLAAGRPATLTAAQLEGWASLRSMIQSQREPAA